MRPDDWHLTEDVDDVLARAGDFLRSRPALHNTPLTTIEKLRTRRADAPGTEATVFGLLESGGEVRALCYRLPTHRLTLTPSPPSRPTPSPSGWPATATASPASPRTVTPPPPSPRLWRRHADAVPEHTWRGRLYRLGTLTPQEPFPPGRGRLVGEQDHAQLLRWCGEFVADVGEAPSIDAGSWAGSRFRGQTLHVLGDAGRHPGLHGGLHRDGRRHGPGGPRLHPRPVSGAAATRVP